MSAYSAEIDHGFRLIATTGSGASRPLYPFQPERAVTSREHNPDLLAASTDLSSPTTGS